MHNTEQAAPGSGFVNDVGVTFGVQYVSAAVRNATVLPPFTVAPNGTPSTRVPHTWLPDGLSTVDPDKLTLRHHDQD